MGFTRSALLFSFILLITINSPFAADQKVAVVDVSRAIDRAAGYLVRHCDEDGSFTYLAWADRPERTSRKYNLLRHAGAIYALSSFLEAHDSVKAEEAIRRSTDFLLQRIFGPVVGAPERALALWSVEPPPALHEPLKAKLGGSGLALVALGSAAPFIKAREDLLDTRRRLGLFIIYMQKEDGSFNSLYFAGRGPADDWISLYYPGEAMLGMLMLYEDDHKSEWLECVGRGMAFLARSRKGVDDVPADHWALLASRRLVPYMNAPQISEYLTPAEMHTHAVQICDAILAEQITAPDAPAIDGAFGMEGYTCPASTRLEGLLAALGFLPEDKYREERRRIVSGVHRAMKFLISTQITDGYLSGGFPRAARLMSRERKDADRFNLRAREVRVDYVQHALSAMLHYRKHFYPQQAGLSE